jgi:hypothetical protein
MTFFKSLTYILNKPHCNHNFNLYFILFFSPFASTSADNSRFNCLLMQKNLKYKWLFNSTIDNLIELPSNTNDPDLHYNMQHEHQPQHIDTASSYKTKNNYNSIELQPRSNQYTYSKKYQGQQQQINYPNAVVQSYDGSYSSVNANNHHHNNNQGAYFYKVENFTSFGTISCSAENQYGSSGPCFYHIMVAGECRF